MQHQTSCIGKKYDRKVSMSMDINSSCEQLNFVQKKVFGGLGV